MKKNERENAMKKKIKQVSKCCGAELTTEISPDFLGDNTRGINYIGTCCYICSSCNRPCDIKIKKERKNGKTC